MAFIVHGASAFHAPGLDLATPISQPKEENALTCTTCGFTAANFEELREHYKTEWHRHNLKRKVAQLAPLTLEEFQERVAAFLGQSDDRSKKKEHLGKKARDKQEKRDQVQKEREEKRQTRAAAKEAGGMEIEGEEEVEEPSKRAQPDFASMTEDEYMQWREENAVNLAPGDSLFDQHSEHSLAANLEYMSIKHGFFVPFVDQCNDVAGLVEYLGLKLSVGCVCMWCNKAFHSLGAVQAHMRDKAHCKMNLEGCEEEYQDFYDVELMSKTRGLLPDDEDDAWDTEEEEEVDDMEEIAGLDHEDVTSRMPAAPTQGRMAEAARLSKKHAKTTNVLEVGENVLGHRAFQRYYRQKLRPEVIGPQRHRSETNTKIQLLLQDAYRANSVMTVYKGRSRIAKNNKDVAKRDTTEADR
jgi:pre-60S factor REI1